TPVDLSTFRGTNQAFFPVTPGTWGIAIHNPGGRTAYFDIQTILTFTNDVGNFFEVLSNLNVRLAPNYRYESGTSMAAGFASGSLALMHEFFSGSPGNFPQPRTNSPALMKALLINGARSLACAQCPDTYNYHPNNIINYQGWGLINLTNTLPLPLRNGNNQDSPL